MASGVRVIQAQGGKNSIQNEFNDERIQPSLLEFNENLEQQRIDESFFVVADNINPRFDL